MKQLYENLYKCLKIADTLNDEIEEIEGLSELFYFTVETFCGITCQIKFMGETKWDTENFDTEDSEDEIINIIRLDLQEKSKIINKLVEKLFPDNPQLTPIKHNPGREGQAI